MVVTSLLLPKKLNYFVFPKLPITTMEWKMQIVLRIINVEIQKISGFLLYF